MENDIEYGDYLFGEDDYQTNNFAESDSTTDVTSLTTDVTPVTNATNVTDELKVKFSEGEISEEEEENEFGNLKSRLSQTLAAIKSWKKTFPEDL